MVTLELDIHNTRLVATLFADFKPTYRIGSEILQYIRLSILPIRKHTTIPHNAFSTLKEFKYRNQNFVLKKGLDIRLILTEKQLFILTILCGYSSFNYDDDDGLYNLLYEMHDHNNLKGWFMQPWQGTMIE